MPRRSEPIDNDPTGNLGAIAVQRDILIVHLAELTRALNESQNFTDLTHIGEQIAIAGQMVTSLAENGRYNS